MGGTAGQRRAEKTERDTAKADGAAKAKSKAEEDAYWAAAGEGSKSKAQAKREAAETNADTAAASKAEAKRLAKLEEEELANVRSVVVVNWCPTLFFKKKKNTYTSCEYALVYRRLALFSFFPLSHRLVKNPRVERR